MNRRNLLLGGALALSPFASAAQPSLPVVGFVFVGNPQRSAPWTDAWYKAMGEAGFVEGRNFATEYRWAEGDPGRMPAFAADLVARRVAVIVTTSPQGAAAARQATTTIPIVFNYIFDPVGKGFVASITHPGGNITGIADFEEGALESKRLQLLHQVMPGVTRVGYLVAIQDMADRLDTIDAVAATGKKLGIEVALLRAGKVEELDTAFAAAKHGGMGAALVMAPSTFLYAQQKRVLETASSYGMPLVAGHIGFARDGGLMRYSVLDAEVPNLTANYVVRILKGQKPAELPVQRATKFTLSLNLKTAKAFGITFPPAILGTADEVIE